MARQPLTVIDDEFVTLWYHPEEKVVPSTAVAELQMKALRTKRQKQGLTVEMFETVDDAMAWLTSR